MSEFTKQVKKYAITKHREVNHKYANGLDYDFHLALVVEVANKFIHLIPEEDQENVIAGCWVHDIIEDARETYNDVKKATNEEVAELAYALTNEKGRNRSERANDKYYEGIRNTPHAAFIKFCDRIANYSFSKSQGSSMAKKYEKENANFIAKIYDPSLYEIARHLCELMGEDARKELEDLIWSEKEKLKAKTINEHDEFKEEINTGLVKHLTRNKVLLEKLGYKDTFEWVQQYMQNLPIDIHRERMGDQPFNISLFIMGGYNSLMMALSKDEVNIEHICNYLCTIQKHREKLQSI